MPILTKIKGSSNVASAGWESGVLYIRFHIGGMYSIESPESTYQALLAAPSVGRFVRENLKGLTRCGDVSVETSETPKPKEPEETNAFGGDQGACCFDPWSKASLDGSLNGEKVWHCPRCGTRWEPDQVGSIRRWFAAGAPFEIIRR